MASSFPKITVGFACPGMALTVFVMLRLGLLTLAVSFFVAQLLSIVPVTTDFSAWYSGNMIVVLTVLLALAGYAFHTSLGGQKLFLGKLLEE